MEVGVPPADNLDGRTLIAIDEIVTPAAALGFAPVRGAIPVHHGRAGAQLLARVAHEPTPGAMALLHPRHRVEGV